MFSIFNLFNNPRRFLSFFAASVIVWWLGYMMMPNSDEPKKLSFGPYKIEVIDSTIGYDGAEYTVKFTNVSEMAVSFSNITMKAYDNSRFMLSIDQQPLVKLGEMMYPGEERILSFYMYDAPPGQIYYYTFGPSGLEFAKEDE